MEFSITVAAFIETKTIDMKQFIIFILILLFPIGAAIAQSKTERKANDLYELNKFSEAIPLYQKALSKSDSKSVKTKLANCYRRTNQMSKAEELYAEIIQSGRFNDKVLLYYSETLMTNEKYGEAKDYLKRYITRRPDDEKAHLLIASCDAVKTIEPYFPVFNQKKFTQNSENDDSSPVYYRNGIAFTSDRNQGTKFLKKKSGWTGRDYAMIYYSAQNIDGTFEIPVSISPKFNDLNINSGPISFTADNQLAVFSRNSKTANNSDEYPMQLYTARADQDGKWRDVELVSFCKNTHSYMHPALSPDGRFLFYVTDRRNGQGGTDIYVAERKTNGSWGDPQNLGPVVNTALNEGFPFVHPDGRLFFSSKGHPGYGGFDLFVTHRNAKGEWTTPVNLGRPVNSSVDDVSFFLFEDETGGFYSSSKDSGNDDIFLFSLTEEEDVLVRFEDKPEKKVFVNNPVIEENSTTDDSSQAATETSEDEIALVEEPVYQPASEIATNEPFDDGQKLNEDTEALMRSEDQKAELDKSIIPDTQVNNDIPSDNTRPDNSASTITDLEKTKAPISTELVSESSSSPPAENEIQITESDTNTSMVANEEDLQEVEVAPIESPATDRDGNSSIASNEEGLQVDEKTQDTEEQATDNPVNMAAVSNKDNSKDISQLESKEEQIADNIEVSALTPAEEPKQEAPPTEDITIADKPNAPQESELVQNENIDSQNQQKTKEPLESKESEVTNTEQTNLNERPSSTIKDEVNPTSPTDESIANNTPAVTESNQNLEIYPAKEPNLQPEVVEEVRPFKDPTTSTTKTIDAFGAIEQELSNNTLSVGRTFVLPGVKYPFNEFVYQVSESIQYELDRLASLLKDNPDLQIEIACYSESFGEDNVNKALSRYRAKAASDYLVRQGIEGRRIRAEGYGEEKPLNHCINGVLCTRDDHMVNQRMEVKILGL